MDFERDEPADLSSGLTSLSGLLLSREKLDAVLELVVSVTSRALPHAVGVSVTLARDTGFATPVYSNELSRRVDEWQYAAFEGPCLDAARTGAIFRAPVLATDERWPAFGAMAEREGVRSILAIPFRPMGEPIGTLNIYSAEKDGFDDEEFASAKLFAEQAAVVIANSVAYTAAVAANDQLREALESREVIGRATGILMEREGCSAEDAFEILRAVSMRTNRKVRQVAVDVVAATSGSDVGEPLSG